jgi:hypothetical protein
MTKNDITGDPIKSRTSSDAYRVGWDAIFGNKEKGFRVNPDLLIREIGKESVILDQKSGIVHNLNETATRIFIIACSPYRDEQAVIDEFFREYECEDVDVEQARKEVAECIEKLKQKRIILS